MRVDLPRPLTREEALMLDGINDATFRNNASPALTAARCGIPLDHALIALRALKEMGILPEHYREWLR